MHEFLAEFGYMLPRSPRLQTWSTRSQPLHNAIVIYSLLGKTLVEYESH